MICTPVRVQIGAKGAHDAETDAELSLARDAQGVWNGRGRGRRPAAGHHCGGHDMEAAMDAHCQSMRDRKAGASVTRKQGCSSCAWAFREEQPGGMTALRCGYRAGAADKHLRGRTESGCCSQVPAMEELPSYFRREWTAAQTEGRQPGAEDTSFRKNISRNRGAAAPCLPGTASRH